jgi:hypothetical protein
LLSILEHSSEVPAYQKRQHATEAWKWTSVTGACRVIAQVPTCTLVTGRSGMPQGVMSEKGAKSGHTLSARPWYVTQRVARTPMAATLAPPTQTPVRPSARSPARPDTSSSALWCPCKENSQSPAQHAEQWPQGIDVPQ